MFKCAIALLDILDLDPEYASIVGVLAGDEAPKAVWVVFYDGEIIAVFLTPHEAYARLLNIIEGIERGQLPVMQTLAEAELFRDLREDPSALKGLLSRRPRVSDDPQP